MPNIKERFTPDGRASLCLSDDFFEVFSKTSFLFAEIMIYYTKSDLREKQGEIMEKKNKTTNNKRYITISINCQLWRTRFENTLKGVSFVIFLRHY